MSDTDKWGRYVGRLVVHPLPDGRLMELEEPFGFHDAGGKAWSVPQGARVDGASIPRALWSLIGGPFEGKYRDASVVHDYYCDTRREPWGAVHRVFYCAMRASGVSETRAKLMYAAVYFAGPRWSDTAVHNVGISRGQWSADLDPREDRESRLRFEQGVLDAVEIDRRPHAFRSAGETKPENQLDLTAISRLIEAENPSLATIDEALERALQDSDPVDAVRSLIAAPAQMPD